MKDYFLSIFCLLMTACSASTLTPEQQQEALSTHNQLRAKHQAPVLSWDSQLARYAASHGSTCEFKHSHGHYGENLAAGYPTVTAAIKAWYAEHPLYSYQHPGYIRGTGHFTQLVWKSSKKLGCAIITCNGKNGTPGNYFICEYSPAGNILGKKYFVENVKESRT